MQGLSTKQTLTRHVDKLQKCYSKNYSVGAKIALKFLWPFEAKIEKATYQQFDSQKRQFISFF